MRAPVGLLRTILTRVIPLAVAALVIMSAIVTKYVSQTVRSESQLRLTENAHRAAELVYSRLQQQIAFVNTLSINELLINSLVDIQERDRYLPLFFRSLAPPGNNVAKVAITDYRGRVIAANGPIDDCSGAAWMKEVMTGRKHLGVSSSGLVAAAPLLYANRPEGMIVLAYGPEAMQALLDVHISGYEFVVLDRNGMPLSQPSAQLASLEFENTNAALADWVFHRTSVNGFPSLDIVALQSTKQANQRVNLVISYLITASLLSVVALVGGIALTVRMTTMPLVALVNQIRATNKATDLTAKLDVEGAAEFQSLANSFNAMLSRLEMTTVSKERLENAHDELEIQKEQLDRSNQQLSRSNDELRQFAYVASHDLQEPLRKVNSFCQLLEQEYRDQLDGDAQTYLMYIRDGATRMRNMVQDLLDFSRVESQGKPLAPTNIGDACLVATENLSTAIEETGSQIIVDPLPTILADRHQLIRLLQNLICNAIRYRRDEPVVIRIGAREEKANWLLFVEDNGIGIDSQFYQRIFVMFKRLHPRSTHSGTGIGLAICKRIVDRLNGRIWVESEVGVGSTFFISVPRITPETTG